jgi:hypothetical protein
MCRAFPVGCVVCRTISVVVLSIGLFVYGVWCGELLLFFPLFFCAPKRAFFYFSLCSIWV